MLIWFQFSTIYQDLICDRTCGLFKRRFHVHLRSKCILLPLDRKSWIYQWDPSALICHLSLVSLLIFYFYYLSIGVSGVLSSTITVLLSVSPFISASVCLMYWGAPMLDAQTHTVVISSSWIDPFVIMQCPFLSLVIFLRSILSDMKIETTAFFWFPFAWNTFFHPLTFCLYVSLILKWVSCRQHAYRFCFCIHSVSLCLLFGVFNPFTGTNYWYICSYCHFLNCLGFVSVDLHLLLYFLTI